MKDWKTELSDTCKELKAIRHKYGNKRDNYFLIIQKIITKKYGLHIPIRYYYNRKKKHPIFNMISLLQQKAFWFGYRQALEDVKEKRNK